MADSKYEWFPAVRRYRDRGGKFVSMSTVRELIEELTENFRVSIREKADKLVADWDENTFYTFALETRADLEDMHDAVATIALGGKQAAILFAHEYELVWRSVEEKKAEELNWFAAFMLSIAVGTASLTALPNRISSYAKAGYATYENAVRLREQAAQGFNEERRMAVGGSTTCDTCLGQASLGWQPLGTLRRIGDSECRGSCRCYFSYRKG